MFSSYKYRGRKKQTLLQDLYLREKKRIENRSENAKNEDSKQNRLIYFKKIHIKYIFKTNLKSWSPSCKHVNRTF